MEELFFFFRPALRVYLLTALAAFLAVRRESEALECFCVRNTSIFQRTQAQSNSFCATDLTRLRLAVRLTRYVRCTWYATWLYNLLAGYARYVRHVVEVLTAWLCDSRTCWVCAVCCEHSYGLAVVVLLHVSSSLRCSPWSQKVLKPYS